MDRQVTQTGALIPNATLLGGEKAKVIGLGYALQAALGTGTAVDGLAISATSPASLSVVIGPGSLMTYAAIDPSAAFGDLGTDTTHFTMKQGLLQEPGTTLTVTPPAASGYSQVFLVQAAYQDADSYTVLPYWNASNVLVPYNGPNNSGDADLTLRASKCVVQLKPGAAATTGSQVAPSPDPGYTPLYLITVANGATQITSANVTLYPTAPFLDLKLPQVRAAIQAQIGNYAEDAGTANAVAVSLPAYTPTTLTKGFPLRIRKSASANTSSLTAAINGTIYPVVSEAGSALSGGEWPANAIRTLTFDGTSLRLGGGGGAASSSGTSVPVVAFEAAGTYSWTATSTTIDLSAIGGGGSGGGSNTYPSGAAGGGGGRADKRITGLIIGQAYTIVVGAGGVSIAANTLANGNTGGTSSAFGVSATGGAGGLGMSGSTAVSGGAGGTGSGGDRNYTGQGGQASANATPTNYAMGGGAVGFAGGGSPAGSSSPNGTSPGAGGGGGFNASASGAGHDGAVYIWPR